MSLSAANPPTADAAQQHLQWQLQRHAQVSGPAGHLALVAYCPVAEPTEVAQMPLRAWLEAGREGLWVEPLADGVTLDGQPLTATTFAARLRPDGTPLLRWQDRSADVFSLDGKDWELRLYDAAAPRRARFAGVATWAYDPEWVRCGRFERYASVDDVPWDYTRAADRGHAKRVPGRVHLEVAGQALALTAFLDGQALMLVFSDGGTGRLSYPPGRFLRLPDPDAQGGITVDFNRAFIPPCGFSDFYSCPLPPESNRIKATICAGEQRVRWRDGVAAEARP